MTTWHVFCDESATSTQHYMLIGGIWCEAAQLATIQAEIDQFKRERGLYSEMKWGKISTRYLQIYKDFIDIFFKYDCLHFRCIVVDTEKLDNRAWHDGDNELAFYKFYYYLDC